MFRSRDLVCYATAILETSFTKNQGEPPLIRLMIGAFIQFITLFAMNMMANYRITLFATMIYCSMGVLLFIMH